jgi:integrase
MNTSITDDKARKFYKLAEPRDRLPCDKIPGFHLLKLKNGASWRYRYTDATGKRRIATVGNYPAMRPKDAVDVVAEWLKQDTDPLKAKADKREQALKEEQEKEHKTLGYYLDGRYSRVMESWPTRSAKLNKQRIKLHFADLLNTPMDEIKRSHIKAWENEMVKKGRAYTTTKRVYTSLKALLKQAVVDRVIEKDPLAGEKLDKPSFAEQEAKKQRDEVLSQNRRLLTDQELVGLHRGLDEFAEITRQKRRNSRAHGKPHLPDLDHVAHPHWFIPFCLLSLHTGLRPGDVYNLTWSELNINFGRLKKITSKSAQSRRSGNGGTLVEMKLNNHIHGVMKDWWEQQEKPETGLVFPSPITGGQLALTAHHKPWKAVKELGGLPESLNFYALRHHFISTLVAQGMPLLAVAKLAGHKSTDMIEQHYGHLCEKQADQAVDIMANIISGALSKAEGGA